MKKRYRAIISLSGGLDSTTLLAFLLRYKGVYESEEVLAVSFNYGSKHNKFENKACRDIAEHYGVDLLEMDLSTAFSAFASDLLLTGGDIPEGHYEEENMKATVVPARNMIFISILAGLAVSKEAGIIFIGVHQGDHTIYPDCRPEFIQAMENAIMKATDNACYLSAPFLQLDKKMIVKRGIDLLVPFNLTRTCYKDQFTACGVCGSCVERLEAFALNEKKDPIMYQTEGF